MEFSETLAHVIKQNHWKAFELSFHLAIKLKVGVNNNKVRVHRR